MIIAVSYINDDLIFNKRIGNKVSGKIEVNSMQELADLVIKSHFAPGVFKNNIKKGDHLESIQLMCYDFDDGTSWKEISKNIVNYKNVIVGSMNHMKDKGDGNGVRERFHVFMALDEPIWEADLYKYAWGYNKKRFGFDNVDSQASDAARYFAKHSCILSINEVVGHISMIGCNIAFENDKRQAIERELTQKKQIYKNDKNASLNGFKNKGKYDLLIGGGLQRDGERQINAKIILGSMKGCGFSMEDAINMCAEHSTWGSSYTRKRLYDFGYYIFNNA